MNRVDWLAAFVWLALLSFGGLLLLGICGWGLWLALAVVEWAGPWVLAHADAIAGAVLAVCVVLLVILAVAERAKKDNPTW